MTIRRIIQIFNIIGLVLGIIFHRSNCQTLTTRSLGSLDFELRSRSPTSDSLIKDLLSVTVNFLDATLQLYYQSDSTVELEKVSASYYDFNVTEEPASNQTISVHYIASVRLTAEAFFVYGYAPDQDSLIDIVRTAFENGNLNFLNDLWTESTDPFLRTASSAVITVNGDETGSESEPSSTETENTDSGAKLPTWVISLIAGASAFCLVFMTCVACVCSTTLDDVPQMPEPPTKTKSSTSKETEEESQNNESASELNVNTNFGTGALRSPSTVRSIASQDSSIFTYNPISDKSYVSNGSKTFGSGFGSGMFTANSGVDVDVQSWQQSGSVIKDEFGHDISAITNKKDLSLIEEEDIDDLSGKLNGSSTQQYFKTSNGPMSPRQYLTEVAVQDLEIQDRWGARSKSSVSQQQLTLLETVSETALKISLNNAGGARTAAQSNNVSSTAKSDLEGSSDVMNDLKDLRYQIDSYRQRTSNS